MPGNPLETDLLTQLNELEARVKELERQKTDDLVIGADKKFYLDGTDRTAYLMWNSASSQIEFYVGSVLEGFIDAANTGTRLQNV